MADGNSISELQDKQSEVPISSQATACLRYFDDICKVLQTFTPETEHPSGFDRDMTLFDMQDASAKFKGWGSNIAAFKAYHPASLDSRLREAHDMRVRILKFLSYLQEYLQDASQIIRGEAPNQTWQDEILGPDSDSETESGMLANEAAINATEGTSELEDLCAAISDANGSLMKLSMLIRLSSNRDDYSKAASRYKDWDPSHFIGHVREKFGSAKGSSDWLINRMGKAILKLRQFLRYREEHHGKLTGDWGEDLTEAEEDIPEITRAARTEALTRATTLILDGDRGKKDGSESGSFGSQTSYEATEFGGDGETTKLTVPPPPKWAFEKVLFQYGKPFRCPYCYTDKGSRIVRRGRNMSSAI